MLHRICKRCIQGLGFNEISNFYVFYTLSETDFLNYEFLKIMASTTASNTVWCCCLDSCYMDYQFYPPCFYTIIAHINSELVSPDSFDNSFDLLDHNLKTATLVYRVAGWDRR